MSLGRAWAQQLLRASGAAVLAPGAVLAALAVLALSGGFGSLGALGEAFAGPSVPGAPKSARLVPAPSALRAGAVLLARATSPVGSPAPAAGSAGPPAASSAPGSPIRPGPGPAHRGGGTAGGGSGPTSNPGGHRPPATGSGPAGPSGHPTLIDGVVSLGASVTSRVPGPVGSVATSTLKSVGHTLDGILGSRSGGSRSVLGGVVARLKSP